MTLSVLQMATQLTRCNDFDQMDAIDRETIINKYGRYEGKFGESTDFGSQTPEMVVINLLVDDGNKSRNNRKMLFEEGYYKIDSDEDEMLKALEFYQNGLINEESFSLILESSNGSWFVLIDVVYCLTEIFELYK